MDKNELRSKTCIPCQGGVPALGIEEVEQLRAGISEAWDVRNNSKRLYRSIKTKDFSDAMGIATKIGLVADEQWHHPELLVGFGHLDIEIWTHKIDGLVESDFIFASKVDQIIEEHSELVKN